MVNDRLPDIDGTPGKGMKVSEAVQRAEAWWDTTGRHLVPEARTNNDYRNAHAIPSGIVNGYAWAHLSKDERLRVVKTWYAQIGVYLIVAGMGTSQDGAALEKVKSDVEQHRRERDSLIIKPKEETAHGNPQETDEETRPDLIGIQSHPAGNA